MQDLFVFSGFDYLVDHLQIARVLRQYAGSNTADYHSVVLLLLLFKKLILPRTPHHTPAFVMRTAKIPSISL
jgi:hypothetical protein